ncbi:hypothetical protein AB0E96_32445, partial [Kitasatospora sp. NPDC036755]|uniref:hypothetical protein n=1 Tax=Kitasatospora sp. NPDC036755 TaxID=3154600 RepID=UPI0033CEAFBA
PGVVSGCSDVHGFAATHSFERLAAHLISEAARRWWTLDVPSEMANFGEILLRHAEAVAMQRGTWTYEPGARQEWADVTVTYQPNPDVQGTCSTPASVWEPWASCTAVTRTGCMRSW